MSEPSSIAGRVVVITGASSGIGAALAEVLGRQSARLVLVARREKELVEVAARSGAQARSVVADVSRRAEVERVMQAALAAFDHVDAWVNNAGRAISRPVSQLTDEDFDDMMQINVKSALYGMQVVLPHFRERGRGHIVNVSSMLGRMPAAIIRSAYSASKAALNTLTANLRMELRASHPDIHVTSVHPGIVATDFGLHAKHGGPDNRKLPNPQPAEEVAEVIAEVLTSPRADVYTRPGAQDAIVRYFAAPDMAEAEAAFLRPGPPAPSR